MRPQRIIKLNQAISHSDADGINKMPTAIELGTCDGLFPRFTLNFSHNRTHFLFRLNTIFGLFREEVKVKNIKINIILCHKMIVHHLIAR